jgi:transcription factor C subunit 6
MHNSPFLASATASGLCRIDWLLGKFHRNRVPFVSVEAIRGEIDQGGGSEDDELLEE